MDEVSMLAMLNRLQQYAAETYAGDQARAIEEAQRTGINFFRPIPERDSFGMYYPIDNTWDTYRGTYVPVGEAPVVEPAPAPSFMDFMRAVIPFF